MQTAESHALGRRCKSLEILKLWRAGDRLRTGDVQLGKLAFYKLNYACSAGRADKRNISGPREAATPPALPYCRTGARGAAKGCGNIDAKPPRSAHRLSTGAPFRYEPSLHNIVAPCGGPEIARAGVPLAAPPSRRRRWTRVIGQSANWCMSRSSRS